MAFGVPFVPALAGAALLGRLAVARAAADLDAGCALTGAAACGFPDAGGLAGAAVAVLEPLELAGSFAGIVLTGKGVPAGVVERFVPVDGLTAVVCPLGLTATVLLPAAGDLAGAAPSG